VDDQQDPSADFAAATMVPSEFLAPFLVPVVSGAKLNRQLRIL